MFKSSIWLMGLLLFLITHSRLASPSAILEYRSTVVPDIEEIKVLEQSREFTSQEIPPAQTPNPTAPIEEESEPALVGEYYDAPEDVLTDPDYIVDSSKPHSGEVAEDDGDHLHEHEIVSLENSKLLAALLQDSHTTQETLRNSVSAETVLDAPAQIDTTDPSEQSKTIPEENEESTVAVEENEESTVAVEVNEESTVAVEESEPTIAVEESEPTIAVEENEPTIAVEENEPTIAVEENEPTITVEENEPTVAIEENEPTIAVEENEPIIAVEENEPIIAVEENEPTVIVEENEPTIIVEENEPTIIVEENGPIIVAVQENEESINVEEQNEKVINVVEQNEEQINAEENEGPVNAIEENEDPNPEINENDEPKVEIEDEKPNAEIDETEEPIIVAVEENAEPIAVVVATEEPNVIPGDAEEIDSATEAPEDHNTVAEVLYNQEDSDEHTEASLEEPDSTEKALEKEVNDIVAAMAAKNELAKAEGTDAPLEVTDLEDANDENLVPVSLPEESNSKDELVENELKNEDDKENPMENSESNYEAPAETFASKILAMLSTKAAPVELSPTGEVVENDETETILAVNPTTSEVLLPEPGSDESENIADGSGTLSKVFNKVRLMSKVLLAFSTQATPEELNPTEVELENGETETILESDPTAMGILTEEPASETDDAGALSKVFNKVRLMSKVLLAFSTQTTPEENNQTNTVAKVDSELMSVIIPTEATLEESTDDTSTLSGVFNKVRLVKKFLSIFSTQATPEVNDAAGDAEENNPTEMPLIILDVSGSSLGAEPSEIPLQASSSENDLDAEEIPSEPAEPTLSVLTILPDIESTESITGGEDDVAGPLESSENVISSLEENKGENTMSERDAGESPVIFEADEDNKSDGKGDEDEHRIQFMESKMTITFVNDGDDYANDAMEGAVNVIIIPDNESDETTPAPEAGEIVPEADDDDDTTPSPDANEDDDDDTTVAPTEAKSSESSSSSSESKEDSSKSSSSESDEETVKLELPMPTDSAETGSTTAPEVNSDESDEDVNTTAASKAETDDAETVDDGESEEKSDSEKILNAVVDDLIKAVAGKPETVDSPAASAATIINFDRTTIVIGGVLMCLSLMSFQEF